MSLALVPVTPLACNPQAVTSFLLKTFEILEKAQFDHIISWSHEGDTFAIKDIIQFTDEVLPKYFRHRNFSSFVRQLNMYDFHKIKQSNDYIVFRNPLFQRGKSHLLSKIRRKAPRKNQPDKNVISSLGSTRIEENTHIKMCFQSSIHQSSIMFEKSLVSMQTIFSLLQKNEEPNSSLFQLNATKSETSFVLDKLMDIQKLSNAAFKSIISINCSVNGSLSQKQNQYSRMESSTLSLKENKRRDLSSDSNTGKSECSIGNKKNTF